MRCPACGNELTETTVSDVKLDVCDGGCGGIWFDNFELKKFDEPFEPAGELLEISTDENTRVKPGQKRQCPRCEDITMMKHFFSVKHEVEVDECAGCGGIWLDGGELAKIRSLFESEEQRKQAGREYVERMTTEYFSKLGAENEAELASARKFMNIFRFVCPSYYVPGKQKWGAF